MNFWWFAILRGGRGGHFVIGVVRIYCTGASRLLLHDFGRIYAPFVSYGAQQFARCRRKRERDPNGISFEVP